MRQPLHETKQSGIITTMQNSLCSLAHYEFIRISGTDGMRFLQGQLSCNTDLLTDERSLTGALCNLKGRVIADCRLLKHGEDIILQCAQGMAGKILATLSKYAVFSKVVLLQLPSGSDAAPVALGLLDEAVNEALNILGLTLPESANGVSSTAAHSVIRVAGTPARLEIWAHTADSANTLLAALKTEPSSDIEPWQRADIEAGIVHVTPPLSEEFTPEVLNYDLSGLIDFKKGCYTGQEVVARMYYRGTAKRRLQIASCTQAISESSKVVLGGGEEKSEDILAFSNTGSTGPILLAILPLQHLDAAERMLLSDNPASEVRIRELPYSAAR